ncbi:MAG: alpha/beta hydrolase, partial [Dehalococcoidia bacterium]
MKVKVDDVELYYEVRGEGDPLIFVHGLFDDSSVWNAQAELFSADHQVIVYDLRGHGMSDKPKGNYSMQTLADDLHALIQELNLEKATIVAHSMGGMAAIIFTLDHPDRVSRLVLVSSSAKASVMQRFLMTMGYILPYKTFVRMATRPRYYKPSKQVAERALDVAMNTPK